MDLDAVAFELYDVDPSEFTAARDQRAAEAQRAGDPALAKSIKGLRRPTTAAWLVNLLVRQEPDQVGELIDVGETMRQAQGGKSRDEFRQADTRRRELLSELDRKTHEIGRERGLRISDAVSSEVAGTFVAAVADPQAGEAVRAGTLSQALSYSGFGAIDPADPGSVPARPGSKPRQQESRPRPGRDKSVNAAEVKEAQEAVKAAQASVVPRRRAVRELEERAEGLRRQIEQLDRHRSALKADAATANELLLAAKKEHENATRRLERAEQRLDSARKRR